MEMEITLLPGIVEYPPVPDVTANMLGKRAVSLSVHGDAEESALRRLSEGSAAEAERSLLTRNVAERRREIRYEICDVQKRIGALDSDQVMMFEEYCRNSTPDFLRAMKSRQAFEYTWASWLLKADEEVVLAFLSWHVESHEQMAQELEVQAAIVGQKAEYKEGLKRGIEEGWLHSDAAAAIILVDHVKVYLGDIFDVMFEERSGYHTQGTMEYVIGAGLDISRRGMAGVISRIKHIAKHEDTHAVHPGFRPRWRNEAGTEHIAHSVDHARPDVMNPHKRMNLTPPKYPNERLLLSWLMENGRQLIPARLLTRAYTQVDGNDETQALGAAFDEAWGHITPKGYGALDAVDLYMAMRERAYQLAGMKQIEAGDKAARDTLKLLKKNPEEVFGLICKRLAMNFVA